MASIPRPGFRANEPSAAGRAIVMAALGLGTTASPTFAAIDHGSGAFDIKNSLGRHLRFSFGNIVPLSTGNSALGSVAQVFSSISVRVLNSDTNSLIQRNGLNPQSYYLTNTYTDASNYERGGMWWSENELNIGTEAAGTGTARRVVVPYSGSSIMGLIIYGNNGKSSYAQWMGGNTPYWRVQQSTGVHSRLGPHGIDSSSGSASDVAISRKVAGRYSVLSSPNGTLLRDFQVRDLYMQPSASLTPEENGDLCIEATDNETLTFKLKGSDGTVRSGTVALS